MHDNRSHPLLEQVPLTVSPFVQLPRATTLPYRYKTMPSALPPSIIEGQSASGKPNYVVSPANSLAAHPDDILASCRALMAHIDRMQADADAEMMALDARIQARELAEKRRVAPGWLDSEDRLLVPERKETPSGGASGGDVSSGSGSSAAGAAASDDPTFQLSEMAAALPEAATAAGGGFSAEALDQAFGGSIQTQ